MIEEILYSSCI